MHSKVDEANTMMIFEVATFYSSKRFAYVEKKEAFKLAANWEIPYQQLLHISPVNFLCKIFELIYDMDLLDESENIIFCHENFSNKIRYDIPSKQQLESEFTTQIMNAWAQDPTSYVSFAVMNGAYLQNFANIPVKYD